MKLSDLLGLWCSAPIPDVHIFGIKNDSRQIKPGDLFLAYPGASADGRLHCEQAVRAGAVAVAFDPEALPESFVPMGGVIYVPVRQLAQQLAAIASRFYDDPSRALAKQPLPTNWPPPMPCWDRLRHILAHWDRAMCMPWNRWAIQRRMHCACSGCFINTNRPD